VGDQAWLRALLDVEAALARAQAAVGLVPADHATVIGQACDPYRYDVHALGRDAAAPGNPVLPLVRALRAAVPPAIAESVHKGATVQDILDTATGLVAQRAMAPLLADLAGAADAAARLAAAHRDTPMAGRTLLQQAVPITFGLKAAGWLVALDGAADRLAEVRRTRLAVQLGGAAGTLAGSGERPLDLVRAFADELQLAAPLLPWHTDRTRIADLAGALGTTAGVAGKVARDVVLLAQSEVGEVAEDAPGASSAMPHKRNPVAAVATSACAAQAPGLVATLLATMVQEHERAAGAWHAEWRPLRELLIAVGSGSAWLRECLAGLVVEPSALAANLAHLVTTAGIVPDTGAAAELVDRALAVHAAREAL
jgi:3-carboxy-cis,cis-muconate cycloisomerase